MTSNTSNNSEKGVGLDTNIVFGQKPLKVTEFAFVSQYQGRKVNKSKGNETVQEVVDASFAEAAKSEVSKADPYTRLQTPVADMEEMERRAERERARESSPLAPRKRKGRGRKGKRAAVKAKNAWGRHAPTKPSSVSSTVSKGSVWGGPLNLSVLSADGIESRKKVTLAAPLSSSSPSSRPAPRRKSTSARRPKSAHTFKKIDRAASSSNSRHAERSSMSASTIEKVHTVGKRAIEAIRFSQDSIAGYSMIEGRQVKIKKLKETLLAGYNPKFPLLVVKMPDGQLTSYDNRRLYCVKQIVQDQDIEDYTISITRKKHDVKVEGDMLRRLEGLRRDYLAMYPSVPMANPKDPEGTLKILKQQITEGTYGEMIRLRICLGTASDYMYHLNGYDRDPTVRSLPSRRGS